MKTYILIITILFSFLTNANDLSFDGCPQNDYQDEQIINLADSLIYIKLLSRPGFYSSPENIRFLWVETVIEVFEDNRCRDIDYAEELAINSTPLWIFKLL